MATGIVALGESTGVFFTGPLLQFLLDSFGWRGTYRIMVVPFALVCFFGLTYNRNIQLPETKVLDLAKNNEDNKDEKSSISLYCSVWKSPTFEAVTCSFMTAFAIYIPLIYLVSFITYPLDLERINLYCVTMK